jgi:hypothetical protein
MHLLPRIKVPPDKWHPDLAIDGGDDTASPKLLHVTLFGEGSTD